MTLQNRVDPWGAIKAVPARGDMMGNRGILHEGQQIVREWRSKAWVACSLELPRGLAPRRPFSPGTYSELFFLDEATAFAAGHRPCRFCQRARFDLFKSTWVRASTGLQADLPIAEIDKTIHSERVGKDRRKVMHERRVGDLPNGTMFEFDGDAVLVWENRQLRWSFNGYSKHRGVALNEKVMVLTPSSIVLMFAAGYLPNVHRTALEN